MVSPLKNKAFAPQFTPNVNVNPPGQTVASSLPISQNQSQQILVPTLIKESDVEGLGADLSRNVGATTEKIIQKMGVANFDELGKVLAGVQTEVYKLDPASVKKTGIAGWIQAKFGNIKKDLTVRLRKADAVFTDLSAKISTHITVHTEWVKDLDVLYKENHDRYLAIVKTIETGEKWRDQMQAQLDTWPEIDPNDRDLAMKIQDKRNAEAILNRLKIKLDSFLRLKTVAESNAPKIKSQQETSKTTIMTLRDVIDQTIPMVKYEFTLYLQSLDAQKSIQVVESTNAMANTTLTKSADSAKVAAVNAATALNTPQISMDTLNHIRNRMVETLTEVKSIEHNASVKRDQDKVQIVETQKQYLSALQTIPNSPLATK